MNLILTYFLVYLAVLLFFLTVFSRENSESFLIGNRNKNSLQIALSKYSSAINVGWLVVYTSYAYRYGIGTFTLLLGTIAGYLFFAFFAIPKIYKNSVKEKFYTIGDLVYFKFKSIFLKNTVNIIGSLILFFWSSTLIIGSSKILEESGFLSYEVSLIFICLIVLFYIFLNGYRGVLITDIIQSIFIFLILIFIAFSIIGNSFQTIFLVNFNESVTFLESLGFLIFGILVVFSLGNFYQLVYCAKSKKASQLGFLFSIIPIIFSAFLLFLISLYVKSFEASLSPEGVFFYAINNFLSQSLFPIVFIFFMSAIMSSLDSNIFSISSQILFNKKNKVKKLKLSSLAVIFLLMIFCYIFREIVNLTVFASILSITLSVPMIYLIQSGKSKLIFFLSIVFSFIGLIFGLIVTGLEADSVVFVFIFSLIPIIFQSFFIFLRKISLKHFPKDN